MALSPKAKLLAANPTLPADYLLDPDTDPNRLSDQLKLLSMEAATMVSATQQRVLDKMMPIAAWFENGRFHAVATCDTEGCDSRTEFSSNDMPSPATLFTKIRNRKWQVSKKRTTCPKCINRRKNPPRQHFHREPEDPPMKPIGEALRAAVESGSVHIDPDTMQPTLEPTPILAEVKETQMPQDTTVAAPTDKAKAAKRHAYGLLLEHYDEDNKRYCGDWSDRKIAGLVNMSEAFVAKIREDDFGPAGPPPQLIDLKARITQLETKLRDREQQVLSAMDEIPAMQEEVQLLKSQLESLVQAHGWSS